MNLTQLAKLLGGQDASVDGCVLSAQEAALTAQEKFKSQPFGLVSEWTILDLEVDEDELNALFFTRFRAGNRLCAPCGT